MLLIFNSFSQKVYPLTRNDSALLIEYDVEHKENLELGKIKEASNFLNLSAMLFWERNHFNEAEKKFLVSLDLNNKLANENGIAMINNNLQ